MTINDGVIMKMMKWIIDYNWWWSINNEILKMMTMKNELNDDNDINDSNDNDSNDDKWWLVLMM